MSDMPSSHASAPTMLDVPPMLSESTKFVLATSALYIGTVLAYVFGVLLTSYLLHANFNLAFHIGLAVLGLHLIAYSLLKTLQTATESYLYFTIALLVLGYATWMIFIAVGYKENLPAFLSGVLIFLGCSALAGWRYRWLHS